MANRSGWKNGKDIQHLVRLLRAREQEITEQALRALDLSTGEGAIATQDILEAERSYTTTGERRVETGKGPFAGRHVSGNMVGSISYNGDEPEHEGTTYMASFGWFDGEFEQYMRDQDLGEGNIPAARALPDAFVIARENFRRRMRRVANGKDAD